MSDIFSIRGRIEALKYLHSQSNDMNEKTVLNNVMNVYAELYAHYGVDVVYKIPDDKIFLNNFESRTYSSFNEDGITEKIFETVGFTNKVFVEMGGKNSEILEKKYECTGSIIDGAPNEFDFLSIDNVYSFRDVCSKFRPRVVVVRYNATYPPPDERVTTPDIDHSFEGTTYYGASLEAVYKLGRQLGYNLVACESTGYSAFLVRSDVSPDAFYGTNDTAKLYRTPKLGHKPCGENDEHTDECMKTYRLDGILGYREPETPGVWTNVQSLSV
jgi:hypothetical protein